MKSTILTLLVLMTHSAFGFCGFYVAKADTSLFNEASKVVLARDGERTVLTMANDFQGEVNEFAMVVPVPEVLEKDQIHVTENKIIDHLDAYTAPRLVEYYDRDPCAPQFEMMVQESMVRSAGPPKPKKTAKQLGVTIEAEYTVGEYDILILSAKKSQGLITWLLDNGYKVPKDSQDVLKSYILQDLKFFVAKVNLKEHSKLGFSYLRPIQVAYESKKFMLPIRLGMANAKKDTPQELFVFALTKKGKVETVNYRTVKIPSDLEIPPYVKESQVFAKFYKDMFDTAAKKEENKVVFMEYAWDMGWCDPCAADPLSSKELKELGVFWANDSGPGQIRPMNKIRRLPRAQNVFVTRLHVRYTPETFADDLRFQVTSDRQNFQGRYILRHPFTGEMSCEQAEQYKKDLALRQEKENTTLAHLTGWDIAEVRRKRGMSKQEDGKEKDSTNSTPKKWWQKIWN